jgi:hypothetical protein
MGHLQNYVNTEETEEQAKDNKRVSLRYTGPLKHLSGKKGLGHYILAEDIWYFQPDGEEDVYRTRAENLDFEG